MLNLYTFPWLAPVIPAPPQIIYLLKYLYEEILWVKKAFWIKWQMLLALL